MAKVNWHIISSLKSVIRKKSTILQNGHMIYQWRAKYGLSLPLLEKRVKASLYEADHLHENKSKFVSESPVSHRRQFTNFLTVIQITGQKIKYMDFFS